MKKYKNDIYALSIIFGFIICIIIFIIIMNVSRKKQLENFNNFKFMNINNRITKYVNSFNKQSSPSSPEIIYDKILDKNVYLIEQIRNKYSKMDDYSIKSNIGSVLYNTEGFWDLNDSKFQIVSTGGQAISVQESGSSRYFFTIGNISISFYYKKVKIFGKIIIDDGDNKIYLYMRQNKKFINFYTEDNNRVAYVKMDKVNKLDKIIYVNRLTINNKYNKYYNIFIIIYIIYLQIYKDQHNTEFL